MKIKTIDITGKEWIDKKNKNSYFSACIIINYGMKSENIIYIPFQSGNGDFYLQKAEKILNKKYFKKDNFILQQYCKNNKILLRKAIFKNKSKKEVENYGIKQEI